MDWVSNLFVVLLLTDVTGTIFYLVGLLFRKLWFDSDVRWWRFQTKVTLIAFGIPFVYLILYVGMQGAYLHQRSTLSLFYATLSMIKVFAILGWVWVAVFLALLAHRLYRYGKWAAICRGNIPEEDPAVEELFDSISAELGVTGKIALYRNDSIDIPCVTYYHGWVVILPLRRYSRQEANVVLYHELCHYVEGDVLLKSFGIVISLLHVFNPTVHILLRQMDLLCEESCDRLVCKKGNTDFTERQYFQIIFDMLLADKSKNRYQLFALVDGESGYERRVLCMKNFRERGSAKRITVLALSACFLLGSSMTALAAGKGMTGMYENVADETREMTDEADIQAMNEIIREYDLDPADVIMLDDIETYGRVKVIDWTVPAGKTFMTSGFTKAEGDSVAVALSVTPEDVTIQTGIKDPEYIMRYVEGEDVVSHTFEIEITGRHYFFVINTSETEDVRVEGSLIR